MLCSGGCMKEKSVNRVFLDCDFLGSIWSSVFQWLGIFTVLLYGIGMHAFDAHLFIRDIRFCFQIIWLACFWIIWNERNLQIFQNKESSIVQLLNRVKVQLWRWLKASRPNFIFDFHVWWNASYVCLGYSTF